MSFATTSPNLDDFLLDIATSIELSERDRRVANTRYYRLKEHLERPQSPLARYLAHTESHIYPQGSMATGTTVVTGTDEDRFDLDALVEVEIAADKTPQQMMQLLYDALKDFPDAVKVVRCTRCVQIQFAFMHMDVTLLDPKERPQNQRAGEIFHCPDTGQSKRVPANPYGFSQWFRASVDASDEMFVEAINKRRHENGVDRLSKGLILNEAKQDDLPMVLPPRLDAEQVVALKLLKRYLYLRYEDRDVKRVPSIYLAKLAVDVGASPYGLCGQLASLAQHIKNEMDHYVSSDKSPDERNPTYDLDKLNDRWPTNQEDMKILARDMTYLLTAIDKARKAEFTDINKIMADLFGEKVSARSTAALLQRAEANQGQQSRYEKGTGAAIMAGALLAPAVARSVEREPRHNFHSGYLQEK
jgi:hypothetical protein